MLFGGFNCYCRYVVWPGFCQCCLGAVNVIVGTLFGLVSISVVCGFKCYCRYDVWTGFYQCCLGL